MKNPENTEVRVLLKKGRSKSILNRHPWIFSGAIETIEGDFQNGDIVSVYSAEKEFLAKGFINRHSQIRIRILSFTQEVIQESFLRQKIQQALQRRLKLLNTHTNAYRVVHSDGDFLPGLILDRYGDTLVAQFNTLGMARLKPDIIQILLELLKPEAMVERSDKAVLKEEGLTPIKEVLYGKPGERIQIHEYSRQFWVDVWNGQKTGFFLDQRENRHRIGSLLEEGMEMLNCFSYSGGFSVPAALKQAATTSVDVSKAAIQLAEENFELNGLSSQEHQFVVADVFEYLRTLKQRYDLIVLDPPAFVKHRQGIMKGARGYKDINRLAIRHTKPGGYLLTCSCSALVDWSLFQKIVFSAAQEAGRNVQIAARMGQAIDHPVNIFHPEGEYLKAFLLTVQD